MTIYVLVTFRDSVVLFNDVFDHIDDAVSADA